MKTKILDVINIIHECLKSVFEDKYKHFYYELPDTNNLYNFDVERISIPGNMLAFFYNIAKNKINVSNSGRKHLPAVLSGEQDFRIGKFDIEEYMLSSFESLKALEDEENYIKNNIKTTICFTIALNESTDNSLKHRRVGAFLPVGKEDTNKNEKIISEISNKPLLSKKVSIEFNNFLVLLMKDLKKYINVFGEHGIDLNDLTTDNVISYFVKLLAISLCNSVSNEDIYFEISENIKSAIRFKQSNSHILTDNNCYFEQTITQIDNNKNKLTIGSATTPDSESEISDYLKINKRILISGDGGFGKTVFLKRIIQKFYGYTTYFSNVIYIPLSTVFQKGVLSNTIFNQINDTYLFSAYSKNLGSNFTEEQFKFLIQTAQKKNFLPPLFIFDGLNEVTSNIYPIIVQEIAAFSILATNATIIVTTRGGNPVSNDYIPNGMGFNNYSISGTPQEISEKLLKKIASTGNSGNLIKELVNNPLYYSLLKKLYSAENINKNLMPKSKYMILQESYINYAKKHTNIFSGRTSQDLYALSFVYFYLLPLLAYNVKEYSFSDKSIFSLIETSIKQISIPYSLANKVFHSIESLANRTNNTYLFEPLDSRYVFAILISENWLNCIGNNRYSFNHQDWHDYLRALYISQCQTILIDNYEDDEISSQINIDFKVLPSSAMEFYGERFGLNDQDITPVKNQSIITNNLRALFNKLPSKNISVSDMKIGFLKYVELAYHLSEYKQNLLTSDYKLFFADILDKVIISIADLYDNYGENIKNYFYDNFCIEAQNDVYTILTNILVKRMEICRVNESFDYGLKLSNIALLFSQSLQVLHQKSKLLIFMAQKDFKNKTSDKIRAKETLKSGIELLTLCGKSYVFSKNLLALTYSFPAPWLFEQDLATIDYCKSFIYYYSAAFDDPQISHDDRNYSLRQMIHLIFDGYVSFQDKTLDLKSFKLRNDCNVICGCGECDAYGYQLIVQILKMFGETNYKPMINFYRGIIELNNGNIETAKKFFMLEKKLHPNSVSITQCFILSNLMLKYVCKIPANSAEYDIDIISDLETLKEKIISEGTGSIDKYHSIYLIRSILRLCLNYNIHLNSNEQKKLDSILKEVKQYEYYDKINN